MFHSSLYIHHNITTSQSAREYKFNLLLKIVPSLMAVKGVPSSSCKRITFRATSFPFTLLIIQMKNKSMVIPFFCNVKKKSIKISDAWEESGLLNQWNVNLVAADWDPGTRTQNSKWMNFTNQNCSGGTKSLIRRLDSGVSDINSVWSFHFLDLISNLIALTKKKCSTTKSDTIEQWIKTSILQWLS